MNKNENHSGQKMHLVIKNFCSQKQLHGPVIIACFGYSRVGHTVNYSHLAGVGGLQN